jgi:hypothetical protein
VSVVLGQHHCADTDLSVLLGGGAVRPSGILAMFGSLDRRSPQRGLFLLIRRINTQRFVSMNYAALAGNLCGDGCDQHCVASQAVWRLETLPSAKPKRPAAGSCELLVCL